MHRVTIQWSSVKYETFHLRVIVSLRFKRTLKKLHLKPIKESYSSLAPDMPSWTEVGNGRRKVIFDVLPLAPSRSRAAFNRTAIILLNFVSISVSNHFNVAA